jgi:hypothetical protein
MGVSAETIRLDFSATIYSLDSAAMSAGYNVNDIVSGYFLVDSVGTDLQPVNPYLGFYAYSGSIYTSSVSVAGNIAISSNTFMIVKDQPPAGYDQLAVGADYFSVAGFIGETSIAIELFEDPTSDTGVTLMSDAIPGIDAMNSFPYGQLFVYQNGDSSHPLITANLTSFEFTASSVPVPPAVWLFGSGLIGLTGIARRKKI